MSEINSRISAVIRASGLTKTAFGERLNVSQSHVSRLANGETAPSDRTIVDICREFGVSEHWLRTGEGEMFVRLSREEEITMFAIQTVSFSADSFLSWPSSPRSNGSSWSRWPISSSTRAAKKKEPDQVPSFFPQSRCSAAMYRIRSCSSVASSSIRRK